MHGESREGVAKWTGSRSTLVAAWTRWATPSPRSTATSYALKDEVADEALYALLADDVRTRERIKDHSGFRVRVRGTKLPEEAGDDMTRVNVEELRARLDTMSRAKKLTPT